MFAPEPIGKAVVSVEGRVLGGVGEEAVPGADGAKEVTPEVVDFFVSEDNGFRLVGDPGPLLEFVFELAFRPAGVADEGADGEAFEEALFGFAGVEVDFVVEFSGAVIPANGAEGELL